MKSVPGRLAVLLCVVSCATLTAVEIWPGARDVRTTDQNGDGRPDVWRHFDARGEVTEVDRDTNFDGKPDVEEYYERGALVRRESDRNFNGQADLIEEFDADTHGQTRSVIDIDYDGTADLLILFRDGRPVFSKRACPKPPNGAIRTTPVGQNDRVALIPLGDPFQSDTAIRTTHTGLGDEAFIGLSTTGGLPSARFALIGRLSPPQRLVTAGVPPGTPERPFLGSPRAPPAV